MRLYLLSEADAAPNKNDAQRKLTPKGIASLGKLAEFLEKKGLMKVAEIRHSPLVSARQTAEYFKKKVGLEAKLREVPLLEPCDDFRILADIVNKSKEDLLLVGHKPNLSMLASYLLTRNSRLDLFSLRKSGLMYLKRIDATHTLPGWDFNWQLRWLIVPGILKKM
ncbi:MAG: phosphohistidine phosphatase SixA [Verrucomicrobia bacterium]|nr:phosphohistidine phosphatase SixA [Verrucomicrobiota bacterium]